MIHKCNYDNRRNSQRMQVAKTWATQLRSGNRYKVIDLSSGGALLGDGDILPINETTTFHIAVIGKGLAPIQARIVHHHASAKRPKTMGVRFENVSPAAMQLIATALHTERLRNEKSAVLVVTADDQWAARIWCDLQFCGHTPIVVQSRLDAMLRLRRTDMPIAAVIVDTAVEWDQTHLGDMMEREFPQIKRIFMGPSDIDSQEARVVFDQGGEAYVGDNVEYEWIGDLLPTPLDFDFAFTG